MKRFIHDETNGLDYELVGDYYLPCLKAPESPKVRRFGLMYRLYICCTHLRLACEDSESKFRLVSVIISKLFTLYRIPA